MTGVVEGGWEYVWAAYGITGAGFLVYAISSWLSASEEGV